MATLTAPTLQLLLSNVRCFLGQPDANNSTWSDVELINYINDGIRRYFSEVLQNAEGNFGAEADLDIVSGSDEIALPDDFFKVNRLYVKDGEDFRVLKYDNRFNTSYSTDGPSSSSDAGFSYFIRSNNIVLRNVPAYSETSGLRLDYIAFPTALVDATDTTSKVSPIFKDLIEIYAVYKAKLSESIRGNGINTYAPAAQHVAELYEQLREALKDMSNYPKYVQPFSPEDE